MCLFIICYEPENDQSKTTTKYIDVLLLYNHVYMFTYDSRENQLVKYIVHTICRHTGHFAQPLHISYRLFECTEQFKYIFHKKDI